MDREFIDMDEICTYIAREAVLILMDVRGGEGPGLRLVIIFSNVDGGGGKLGCDGRDWHALGILD